MSVDERAEPRQPAEAATPRLRAAAERECPASTPPVPATGQAEATDRLFAAYRQCCLDHFSEHGRGSDGHCRCGQRRPCPIETRWEQMLETVIGSAA